MRNADGVELVEVLGTSIIGFQFNEERVEALRCFVRQAVDLAINQEGIADRLMRGFATPLASSLRKVIGNPDLVPVTTLSAPKR